MKERKISMNVKYAIQFLLWLSGTIILCSNGHANLAIVVSGGILLRSFILESRKTKTI